MDKDQYTLIEQSLLDAIKSTQKQFSSVNLTLEY